MDIKIKILAMISVFVLTILAAIYSPHTEPTTPQQPQVLEPTTGVKVTNIGQSTFTLRPVEKWFRPYGSHGLMLRYKYSIVCRENGVSTALLDWVGPEDADIVGGSVRIAGGGNYTETHDKNSIHFTLLYNCRVGKNVGGDATIKIIFNESTTCRVRGNYNGFQLTTNGETYCGTKLFTKEGSFVIPKKCINGTLHRIGNIAYEFCDDTVNPPIFSGKSRKIHRRE